MSNIKWEAQNYCNMELLTLKGGWGVGTSLVNSNFILTVKLLTMGLWPLPVEQTDRLSLASHPHYSTTWTSLCESH